MIIGVKEHTKVSYEQVEEAGLQFLEAEDQLIELKGLTSAGLTERLERAVANDYPYVIITTCGEVTANDLSKIIEECKDTIARCQMPILIENGMKGSDVEGYQYNDFSDMRKIRGLIALGDELCGTGIFCSCVNVGYSTLLAQNTRFIIEEAGPTLQLVHVNDNDGFKNMKQMPYTFTQGRGNQTTDWTHIIGALIRIGFDGIMIFDTDGLFNRTPESLIVSMLQMLLNIAIYWDSMMHFEEVLDCGKKIILFGAGRMASNYLLQWEDRFPPAFMVDNNSSRWGSLHRGYEIKDPKDILEIPEEERLVLLCNMHYEEIGLQLRQMGVSYIKYDDNFYDFVM